MCLLAIHFRTLSEAPILAAANREEFFDRPALPPRLIDLKAASARQTDDLDRRADFQSVAGQTMNQWSALRHSARPERALCGLDARAGGTWLGVNESGLLVAVTNRRKTNAPPAPRSRGRLCLDLLGCRTADEASRHAMTELATGRYAGANYVCVDADYGAVIHAGDRLEQIVFQAGLMLLSNGDLNDPADARLNLARELFSAQPIRSAAEYLPIAKRICGHYVPHGDAAGPSIVLRAADRGTVSSTLVALAAERAEAVYQYAPGAPDVTAYDDYSPLLRSLYDDQGE